MAYKWSTMKEAVKRLEGQPESRVLTAAFSNSIKPATTQAYACQVRRLLKWHVIHKENPTREGHFIFNANIREPREVDKMHAEELFFEAGSKVTYKDYCSFLSAHAGFVRIPFRTLRCGLKHAQMVANLKDVWAGSEQAIQAEKSAIRTGELIRAKRPKGSLSRETISALLDAAKLANPHIHEGMVVQLGGCLRYGELIAIKARHVTPEGLLMTDVKRDSARKTKGSGVTISLKKLGGWPEGVSALKMLAFLKGQASSPDEYLFPVTKFNRDSYNQVIKDTAIDLQWEETLFYDGSHVLRHAGVRRAALALMQANMEVGTICETLHMVLRTVLHYALSNEERIRKINVPQMLEHVKAIKDLPPGFFLTDPDDDDEGMVNKRSNGKSRGPIKLKDVPAPRKPTTRASRKAPSRSQKEKSRLGNHTSSEGHSSPSPSKPSGREVRAERRRIEAAAKQALRVAPFSSRDVRRTRAK